MSKFWRKEILDKREDNMEKDGETPLKTSKKPHSKPFVVERRYVGDLPLCKPITKRRMAFYNREWKKWGSFTKLSGAENSLASWKKKNVEYGKWGWEFRIVNLND